MAFVPGATIGQNLRLVRLLAKGGMGSIWIAEHRTLRTSVAVKFIDEAMDRDPGLLARFEREASAAAQIRSPHVVQILDHGSINGVPYIVMELLEGESLGTRLARLRQIPLEETAVVLRQACKGLSRVHSLSFVHRDIKPDNLFLIDSDGELFVKILDFGVAKQRTDKSLTLTSTGTAVGTPHYMSPEQLLSARDAAPATDLWALGVMAYRALTGALPFDGETFGALCAAVSLGKFQMPRELRPELPEALDSWFLRALAAEPEKRFGSARELADSFVQATGLAESRLSVPLALPPPAPLSETLAAPSGDGSGETLLAPETSSFDSSPRAGSARRLPSGASIAGASLTNRETPRRQGKLVAIGAGMAVVGVAAGVLLARGGPSSGPAAASPPPPAVTSLPTGSPPSAPATVTTATAASPAPPSEPEVPRSAHGPPPPAVSEAARPAWPTAPP
ncbi:MAG: serine/threonine-protein kinase, partial [Polyangiaceae bacterium]